MILDPVSLKGTVHFVLVGPDGRVKLDLKTNNLVVTAGRTFICSRMAGTSSAVMSHMSVGTSNTAPAAGDTTLGAEVGSSRTALTSTTPSSNTIQYACTFGAGVGTGALVEAGLFNDPVAGTMLARTTYSTITKGALDSLTITWTITLS